MLGRGDETAKALGAAVGACSHLQNVTLDLAFNELGLGLGSPGVSSPFVLGF